MATKSATTTQSEPTPVEGQIVHLEYVTADPKALRALLEKQFGWEFEVMKTPGGGPDYHMFSTPGGSRGGVTAPPQAGAPLGTFAYINVADVKATAKKVEKAGAKVVVPPTEIPNMGWFFQFQVKGGPVMACFQGTQQ